MDQDFSNISAEVPMEAPKKSNKTWLIVLIVVAVLLLCCCCLLVAGIILSTMGILTIPFLSLDSYGYPILTLLR